MGWPLLVVTFICVVYKVESIKIVRLHVPSGASHEAPLDCKYDLEGEELYDVKWFKDDYNIFRCLPNGEVREFSVDGVHLRHSGYANIGSCPFTLVNLNLQSSGEYKCEVSSEAPSFKTVGATARFKYLQTPKRPSYINNTTPSNNNHQQKNERRVSDNNIPETPNKESRVAATKFNLFICLLTLVSTFIAHLI